jgi:hypothetical protein
MNEAMVLHRDLPLEDSHVDAAQQRRERASTALSDARERQRLVNETVCRGGAHMLLHDGRLFVLCFWAGFTDALSFHKVCRCSLLFWCGVLSAVARVL